MAKQRVRRRSREHRGVKLLDLGRPHPDAPPRGYVARWKDPIDGRWKQQAMASIGITARAAAEAWCRQRSEALLQIRAQVAASGAVSVRKPLTDATRDYLAGFSDGTAKGKRTVLDALSLFLTDNGVRDVADIAGPLLARWRDALVKGKPRQLAVSTQNRWIEAVAAFARWCVDQGYAPLLDDEQIRRSLRRVRTAKGEIEFLQPRDLERLLDAAIRHDRAPRDPLARGPRPPVAPVILLGVLTGMRAGELLGLRWDEVDFAADAIRLPSKRVKTSAARVIGLDVSPAAGRLLRALKLRARGPLVFPDWTQATWDSTRARLTKRYGAPAFTLHTLRRSCGTYLACSPGTPLSTWQIAQRQGHGVQIAERHYVGALAGLPAEAKTIEAALQIEALAEDIVRDSGGLVTDADDREVAQ